MPAYSSVLLIVQVSAPLSASVPDVNVTTITATPAVGIPPVSNTDTTTVTSGSVTLKKKQGLDINCNGDTDDPNEIALTPSPIDTAFTVPDVCLLYEIVVTNVGNLPVTGLTIRDSVLTNTSYEHDCGANPSLTESATTTAGTFTEPLDEALSGNIVFNIGTLAASAQATVTFCLQIN